MIFHKRHKEFDSKDSANNQRIFANLNRVIGVYWSSAINNNYLELFAKYIAVYTI